MDEQALRTSICEVGRLLYERGFIAGTDGNISVRLSDDRFLVTPSGTRKGELTEDSLVIANGAGESVSGNGVVSSEFPTHLAAYEQRDDFIAVVHAHPPFCVALTLAGISLADPILPEVVYALGSVPTAPYATPGTPEGAGAVAGLFRDTDSVLLDRHGLLSAGPSVIAAFRAMEQVEHAARILLLAAPAGELPKLSADQLRRLMDVREKI